jgi:signal transduction histidine kinase
MNMAMMDAGICCWDTKYHYFLTNLLSNAVKFTEMGGVVLTAEVPEASSAESNDKDIHFVVKDTGIGIPKDKIGRLFQPFSQVDASLSRKY